MLELRSCNARSRLNLFPRCAAQIGLERTEAFGVFFDEGRVEDARRADLLGRVVERQNGFRYTRHGSDVAAAADLEEVAGHLGAGARRKHFNRALRILEALEPPLRQRIERNDRYA